jgi:hypothetical protein
MPEVQPVVFLIVGVVLVNGIAGRLLDQRVDNATGHLDELRADRGSRDRPADRSDGNRRTSDPGNTQEPGGVAEPDGR